MQGRDVRYVEADSGERTALWHATATGMAYVCGARAGANAGGGGGEQIARIVCVLGGSEEIDANPNAHCVAGTGFARHRENAYAIRIGWEGSARFSCAQQDLAQHPMTHAGLVLLAPSRRWSVRKSVHYVQGASIRHRLELLRRQPASRVLRARTRMFLGASKSRTAFAMQDTRWRTTENNAQGADQAPTKTSMAASGVSSAPTARTRPAWGRPAPARV